MVGSIKVDKIRSILYKKGIIPNEDKIQYNVPCPFHGEEIGASLSINFDRNLFKCFSGKCADNGIGGKLPRLLQLLKISTTLEKDWKNDPIVVVKTKSEKKDNVLELFDNKYYQRFHNSNYSYLEKRGLKREVLIPNFVSHSNYTSRVYIPYWFEKKCYGIVGRSILTNDYKIAWLRKIYGNHTNYIFGLMRKKNIRIDEKQKLMKLIEQEINSGFFDEIYDDLRIKKPFFKYINNFGMNKTDIVFDSLCNDEVDSDRLLVTEGQINALCANQMGFKSYAILGSYPTEVQVHYIMKKASEKGLKVVLAFDNDEAGLKNKKMFRKHAKMLIPSIDWSTAKGCNDLNDVIMKYGDMFFCNEMLQRASIF